MPNPRDFRKRRVVRLSHCVAAALILAILPLAASACAPVVDLTTGLQVEEISTGWLGAGFVEGKNKIVPKVSFRLKNVSGRTLASLQVNALFRRLGGEDEWGSGFLTAAGTQGLATGTATDRLTLRSPLGYTGTDPLLAMLANSQFVDATVDLFAKYGSTQWTRLGQYPIARQLTGP